MDYKVLSDDDQDDILASFLLATERDHYCHTVNEQRYTEMLPTIAEGPFKERITKLLKDTKERKAEVENILEKTYKQVAARDKVKFAEAAKRIKTKSM